MPFLAGFEGGLFLWVWVAGVQNVMGLGYGINTIGCIETRRGRGELHICIATFSQFKARKVEIKALC